jgi:tellurite methyltransferase
LGYNSFCKQVTIYEEEYKIPEYYWGIEPSKMCLSILGLLPPTRHLRLLDIGCGEGKDAVFFARNGYDVTAFDISDAGIEKAKRLADKAGVNINLFKADVLDFRLNTNYDILFSSGVLHYINPKLRLETFDNYKKFTNSNGIHALNVFVQKPFIAPAPEKETASFKWVSGELFTYYHDWYIHESTEVVFDCNSSGIPHKHAMNKLIAQKYDI